MYKVEVFFPLPVAGFFRTLRAFIKGVDPSMPDYVTPEDLADATDEDKELAREDELIYR